MEARKTTKTYSPDTKEQAVRMVLEHQGEHASQWTAICSIAKDPDPVSAFLSDVRAGFVRRAIQSPCDGGHHR